MIEDTVGALNCSYPDQSISDYLNSQKNSVRAPIAQICSAEGQILLRDCPVCGLSHAQYPGFSRQGFSRCCRKANNDLIYQIRSDDHIMEYYFNIGPSFIGICTNGKLLTLEVLAAIADIYPPQVKLYALHSNRIAVDTNSWPCWTYMFSHGKESVEYSFRQEVEKRLGSEIIPGITFKPTEF